MERVSFFHCAHGADLIVSFAVVSPRDPNAIESLTLLRTPKYEVIFDEHERGVHVRFERYRNEDDDYLEEATFRASESVVELKTRSRRYFLDVRKLNQRPIEQMVSVLQKMNFDDRFQLTLLS